MIVVKNNIIYVPIFTELAIFLVEKSRIDVFYVDTNSSGEEMVLLTNETVESYCKKYDAVFDSGLAGASLFMSLDEIPKMEIMLDTHDGIVSKFNTQEYNNLNWDKK